MADLSEQHQAIRVHCCSLRPTITQSLGVTAGTTGAVTGCGEGYSSHELCIRSMHLRRHFSRCYWSYLLSLSHSGFAFRTTTSSLPSPPMKGLDATTMFVIPYFTISPLSSRACHETPHEQSFEVQSCCNGRGRLRDHVGSSRARQCMGQHG